MEFDLEAGDVVYIPRGAIHSAKSSTDVSLHITTGLIAYTWADLLLQAVVAAGMDDVKLRENLPMGWPGMADDPQLAREYQSRVASLITHITSAPPPFGVLSDNLTEDYNSLSSGLLKRAIQANELTLSSVVRIAWMPSRSWRRAESGARSGAGRRNSRCRRRSFRRCVFSKSARAVPSASCPTA